MTARHSIRSFGNVGSLGNQSGAHSPEFAQAGGAYLWTLWVKAVISAPIQS